MAGHRGSGLAMIAAFALAACQQGGDPAQAAVVQGNLAANVPPPAANEAAPVQADATAAMPPPLDTSRMQPAQIIDQNGFGQPMVAADVQIPAGWQTVGGVSWNDNTNCVANQLQLGWSAMAPDSLTAVEILPGFNWQVAGTEIQMNPCPAAPWRSTREFLEATVQRTRPGARVLGYERLADVEQRMAQSAQANPQAQLRHDAGRLLIGYAKDGVAMQELLSAAITFSSMQGNVVAGTATISSLRAPEGRLDRELGKRIGDSMRANPQWMQAMQQRSMASLERYDNAQAQLRHDAGRLLIGYAKDGVAMQELLSAAITFSSMQGNVVAGTATISSLRAPEGRLDRELGKRIGDSMRANPQWMQAMQQRSMASLERYDNAQRSSINDWHHRQMAIINARGAADRAAIRMRGNQEVAGIYSAIAANSSATSDRMHKTTMSGVQEVDNYAGVDGSTVQASIHGGDRVFQDTANPGNAYATDAPYAEAPAGYVELQREQ